MKNSGCNECWIILLYCLIGAIFTLPSFISDFYSGHNVLTHLIWSRHFAEQLWNGDPYPRWLINMNDGLGSPAFYFYFPLPYFITSIFHAPFLNLGPDGWLQLGLACAAALSLSGVSCYAWLRPAVGQSAAAVGALVYMLLPYHLLVDLYYRFAFTEFWTFAFMPLCLFFADRIRRNEKFGVTGGAISYALLFLTHLPTVLIFSPVLLCYIVATGQPGKRTGPLLRLSCALLLGAGLSAFYWVPAISTQANVSFANMSQGEFYFENNFLFSPLENNPKRIELGSYHSFLSFSTLFTLAVCLISWLANRRRVNNYTAGSFWIVVCLFSFFMMLDISSWLWHMLPLLPRIQFPYRFNALLAVGVAAVAASAMKSVAQDEKSTLSKVWIVAFAAFFTSQMLISGVTVYKRATSQWDLETRKTIDRELALSPEVLEYLPHWANAKLFPVTNGSDQLNELPVAKIVSGEGNVSVGSWGPGGIVLQTRGATPLLLVVRHLYYPNWKAHLEPQGQSLSVSPSADHGFISMEIPAGSQRVALTLEPDSEESLGRILSILSSVALLVLLGSACFHNIRQPER